MKANSPALPRRLLALALAAASVGAAYAATPASAPTTAKPDVVADHIDTSVKPGDDFFEFANGAWLKSHPIPAEESQWGIGQVVQDELYTKLRKISEDAAADKNAKAGSDQQKVGDFWTTAMDQAQADKLGITPLNDELARIDAVHDVNSALDEAFALQLLNVGPFFDFQVSQDEKQSDVMAVHLYQGGLGLPERDYYFNKEKGVARVRDAYVEHLHRTFHMLGKSDADAASSAKQVMAFETALAKFSRPLEDLRDPQKNYNKMSPADLTAKYTPSIAWGSRLAGWKLPASTVIVGQPEFFSGLQALLAKTPTPVVRDYMRAHLVDAYASYLSQDFDTEHFDFYGRTLNGQAQQKPRWKRALRAENEALGMILGRIYVKDYFSEAAKQRYNTMVEAVRTAYGERIDKLDWMSPATKAKAHEKLAAITKKVGYPDKWKDYSTLTIGRTSYAQNMMSATRWLAEDMISKFGKPVDRTEWEMTPQTYNAYYNPSNNEIVLPAAQFMIPGFADDQIDDAVVYGYVAASTIGHEMTHGFDDEGRQYDAKGNLADWWTKEDATRFKQRADVMVKQFNAYEPLPGIHINGQASLGENIADFGGIMIGLDAFKKTEQYKKGEKIAGYTPLQRFFLGYALGWLSQEREEMLRTGLLSDVHAPAKWRVNGPLSNVPDFYEAFGVKQGQPMWRPENQRVKIW
ncbi:MULTISPECIES: M13 family metallopeptidase [unclassified Dyella]|uniref:M13 family metallopeptidase n=1 Tax=unclassified Dyella TaxID=2634549 RepID=UPI000C854FF7|nr:MULTISPECIES: M13 family metallopeptidase [unclassified Dyella]MDR3444839.1 M13 family metallopeptidase [Dyella sp.]PMQ06096.1 Neutral endopeptidase [Dyella sp. AD56]